MDIYKKEYAQLVGKVDNAITALDEVIRNPLCTNITECAYIRGRLVSALLEAEELIVKAHNAQTEVIQSQVAGENMEYSLLFIHAQDTIMTINTELRMTKKLLPIVKMLMERKK